MRTCRHCRKPLTRRQYPNGSTEPRDAYHRRKHCNSTCEKAAREHARDPNLVARIRDPYKARKAHRFLHNQGIPNTTTHNNNLITIRTRHQRDASLARALLQAANLTYEPTPPPPLPPKPERRHGDTKQQILLILRTAARPLAPREISRLVPCGEHTTSGTLQRLRQAGQVRRTPGTNGCSSTWEAE